MTTSTLENVQSAPVLRTVRLRQVGTALLVLFLAAGLLGYLGDAVRTASTTEDGYTLDLEYPRTARAGLDVPWTLTITNEAGFGAEIEVRVTEGYFSIYEHQGISPAPSAETSDDTYTYWTFDAPEGTTFSVDIDHYVQPASQVGASGTVALMVDGQPTALTEFSTTLLP